MKELFKVWMNPAIGDILTPVLKSGYIGQGPKVEEFEKKLSKIFNSDYVITTNSATSAEHLALHILKEPKVFTDLSDAAFGISSTFTWDGLDENSEVLSTPLTCTASNWPTLANNLKIKWVDIDPNTMNMDLDDLERKITRNTRIIMIVYWGGYPVDIDRLKQILSNCHKTFGFIPIVIQDCAHAVGSTYKGRHIADQGFISTFSFQAIKHVTCGDGGAVVFPYIDLYKEAKLARWYGIDRESNRKDFRCEADIKNWGFKFHMNDISATIGLANLESYKDIINEHRKNAQYYNNALKNIPGLTLLENKDDRESSYWIYTIKVERKDDFVKKMTEAGIQVSRVHERNDKHTCVKEYRALLPNLDKVVNEMICIPVGWWLSTSDLEFIVDKIKEGW